MANAEGCSALADVNINVLQYPVVSNAFTSNGDRINDAWEIKCLD